MACYHPLTAYRGKDGKKIVFDKSQSLTGIEIKLPCQQCIGCRLRYSQQWAIRMMHEASQHTENSFITLTYDEDNLPKDRSLNKTHYQKFMKRLRKKYAGKKIRYFHCGEYGEETYRPHYHAILFGHDFTDKKHHTTNNGNDIYTSSTLADLWPYGFNTIGQVSFESAAYVARYITKKITGKRIEQDKAVFGLSPYNRCDMQTGELYEVQPEYATMSRRPGIGKTWFEKYKGDCYPSDYIIIKGKKMQPPKYYDSLYSNIQDIKDKRKHNGRQYASNNTPHRLRIRETVKMAALTQLKRGL